MTFSIVAWDRETGDLGCAVASKFPAVGAVVPWVEAGVGAVAYSFATACAEILPPNRRVLLCPCGSSGNDDFNYDENPRYAPPAGEGSDAPLIAKRTWLPVPEVVDGPLLYHFPNGASLLDFAIRQANRAMA